MPVTLVRTACAVALVVPLVLALGQSPAGANHYPDENDCTGNFGAVTGQPGPDPDCYGIDQRRRGGDRDRDWDRDGRFYGENGPYGHSAPQYYPGPYGPW
ncbi:MAG: hypothetical protein ACT4QF_07855 [Sporichthyaceae bacterium]|jgi:hypothetical protein